MIKSIKNNVGYKGYVILNTEGVVVRWDPMPYEQAVQHACLALDLYDKSKLSVNEIFVSALERDTIGMAIHTRLIIAD